MSVGRQLPRFVVAGAIGFVVDAGVLYAALSIGLDYYTGRLASFFAAVVTTWLINRSWTFDAAQTQPTVAEFVRYFGAMSLGGAVNYATYAVIVATAPRAAWLPLVAVAAGSVAGLGVNFATARRWVFAPATAGAMRGGMTAALVLLQIALAAVIGHRILDGTASFVNPGDAFGQSFMWLNKVFTAAREGELALWDFTTLSGVSFIGEQQTAPLYPPALLFGWLGIGILPKGYDHFLLLHFVIAAAGTSLLLRALGLGFAAAVGGSLLFAYTGSFPDRLLGQPNLFSSLAYMPWIALGLLRVNDTDWRRGAGGFAIAAAAAALSSLAGHLHAVAVGMVAAVVLAGFHALPNSRTPQAAALRALAWGVAILAFALLLALPQVVATHEYLKLAYKWNSQGSTRYPHVASAAEYALFSLRAGDFASLLGRPAGMKDHGTLFFTLTGLAFVVALPLVIWRGGRQERAVMLGAVVLLAISLVFAAGFVYPQLPILNQVRQPTRWLFAAGLALAILASFSISCVARIAADLAGAGRNAVQAIVVALAFSLIFFESYRHFTTIERPPWSANGAAATLETPVVAALLAEMGRHPPLYRYYAPSDLVPPNLGNLRFALGSHGHRATRTVKYHDYFDFNPNGERVRSLGVRWWVAQGEVAGLKLIWSDGKTGIYERPDALPVLWTVDGEGRRAGVAVRRVEWRQNRVTFYLDDAVAGSVVFAQAFYPGFRAYADTVSHAVEETGSLMSVHLDRPAEVITFEYRPAWWGWTSAVAAAGWVVLFLLLLRAALAGQRSGDAPGAADRLAD